MKYTSFIPGIDQLDPRAKLVVTLIFIAFTVQMDGTVPLLSALSVSVLLVMFSRISIKKAVYRFLWLLPFAVFSLLLIPFVTPGEAVFTLGLGIIKVTATKAGLYKGLILCLRLGTAGFMMTWLTGKNSPEEVLASLRSFKFPPLILEIITFILRYGVVLQEEVERMRIARQARMFKAGKNLWQIETLRVLGQLIAALFLRSYRRSDRVYRAMLARGHRGKMISEFNSKLSLYDYIRAIALVSFSLLLFLFDKGLPL